MTNPGQHDATCANVGDPLANLCARTEAFCRRIAPIDLANSPLYVVPQSRIAGTLAGPNHCCGFTCPSLDLYLRDSIGPAWRGRGAAMVINDILFAGLGLEDTEFEFLITAIHELAHILERPAMFRERPVTDLVLLQFEALVVAQQTHAPAGPAEVRALPLHHDDRFIRTALHLWRRASLAGVDVPASQVCPHRYYGLTQVSRYIAAIGDEPERMLGAGIREVLATPAPSAFARLWAKDFDQWFCHHPTN